MKKIIINPIKYINGTILIPGSKSISNRILLLSSLCFNQETEINNLLDCDDVRHMIKILKKLGIKIINKYNKNNSFNITGFSNIDSYKRKIELYCGNSGTTFRSILSFLSLYNNCNIILTGDKRMKERPIKDLVDSLRIGKANISYLENYGFPSLNIFGGYKGGNILIDCSISSQFLSSILMISPLVKINSNIIIKSKLVSKPYIDITIKLMKIFGINIINNNYKNFYINGNQKYISPKIFNIEGDMSSASYFLAAGAMKKGNFVKVIGIGKKSIQGDIKFVDILKDIGVNIKVDNFSITSNNKNGKLKYINIDANDIPDSAMTLSILALYIKNKKSIIKNIYNWRVKETDRLFAMSNELKKTGSLVEEGIDYISILPPKKFKSSVIIETYNDHRIAMCFSLLSLLGIKVTILNPNCVNKTFPKYFYNFLKISKFM